MATVQETEHFIIKGLNPHADSVDTQTTQSGYELRRYIIRITLYSEFQNSVKPECGRNGV